MSNEKKLDRTITTIGDFKKATEALNENLQIYTEEDGVLIEVTEVMLVFSS